MQEMEQIQISVNKNSYENILPGGKVMASPDEVAMATTKMEEALQKWLADNALEAQINATTSTGRILIVCRPEVGNALAAAHQNNEFPEITQFLRNVQKIKYSPTKEGQSWGDKVGEKRDFGIS